MEETYDYRQPKEIRENLTARQKHKWLTVGQLIEKLNTFDRKTYVMIYDNNVEDGGMVKNVTKQTLENMHYFNADHPFDYLDLDEAVCIES